MVEVEPNQDYVLFFYSNITSRTGTSGSCQIKVVGETGAYLKAGQVAQTANPSLMNQWYLNTYGFNSGDSTCVQIWIQDGGFTGSFDDFRIELIH